MSEIEKREDGEAPGLPSPYVEVPPDASADEKLAAAGRMRANGLSWREIGAHLGYDPATARVDYRRWLSATAARIDADSRLEALELELERYDELTKVYMPAALAGHLKAAETVLKISAMRAKVLDFEGLHSTDAAASTRTIIIPMGEGEYAARLKEIVEGSP